MKLRWTDATAVVDTEPQTYVAELVFALCCAADVTYGTNVLLFKAKLVVVHSDSVGVDVELQRRHDCRIWPNSSHVIMLYIRIFTYFTHVHMQKHTFLMAPLPGLPG